jgi:N6-L-threonylcarbamoyladenine synthase
LSIIILGIESSCDDTSAAVIRDGIVLSNILADQKIHAKFGGVVPELASRAHQQNIIPVIDHALQLANINKKQLNAIAYTQGPGLLGSLLVGSSFAKAFALALGIPLISVHHLQAHVFANFIRSKDEASAIPSFPFLCLLVSGGHTQIIIVKNRTEFEIIGQSIDDAAGEAFDKAAKILGLPYPGGPFIDQHAKNGNTKAYAFPRPQIQNLDFSFSGLKTSFLYLIRDKLKENTNFVTENIDDLCASYQSAIIEILISKIKKASSQTGIKEIAIAGGVSVNSALRERLSVEMKKINCNLYIPKAEYCTDNAAMIAMAGYFKYLEKDFSQQDSIPFSKNR